jgi:hypothetical protein
MEEDDFTNTGNLPQIAATKSPPGPASSFGGFGGSADTGFGGSSNGFGNISSSGSSAFGQPSSGGFGSSSSFGSSVPSAGFATAANNNTSGQAAGAMHSGGESTVALDKDAQDWINKKWRPVMGWIYMLTCTMDFVIFPILWSLLQALSKGSVTSQWQPLTLQGAGLYHIAMGAVLGIAAYGRTKEKVEGKA